MKWIEYQIVQCTADEEDILITKRVGYNDTNLAIAETEAYNGEYSIVEDGKSFNKEPLDIEFGGTDATNPDGARENLGAAAKSASEIITVVAANWTGDAAPYTAVVASTLATADNHLIVGAGGAVTAEQQEAMAAAMIICTKQAAGSITLTAYGDKPEVNLPVNIICVG